MRKLMLSSAILGAVTLGVPAMTLAQTEAQPGTPIPEAEPALPLSDAPAAAPMSPAVDTMDSVADGMAAAPASALDAYAPVAGGQLMAGTLIGATVYDAEGNSVGSISDLVLSSSGEIEALILPVGGILGMGSTPVSLPFEAATLMQQTDGNGLAVQVAQSREQIEAQPAHEG